MKRNFRFVELLVLAVCPLMLRAESVSNDQAKLEWKNGIMEYTVKAAPSAKVTFSPYFTNGTELKSVKATVFPYGKKAILLHGKECSLTFMLSARGGAVRVSAPKNAGFSVKTDSSVIVAADGFGEDAIIEPGESSIQMPGIVPFFMGLQGQQGDWTLSCIPYMGRSDIRISADLKKWNFRPALLEEYTFVIQSGKEVWKKIGKLTDDKNRTEIDWKPPFRAAYRAAFPIASDFVKIGKPRYMVWKVGELKPKDPTLYNRADRVGIVDKKAQTAWSSGFYGTFPYPAYLPVEGKLQMIYPRHSGKKFAYDRNRPIYLYTYSNGIYKALPNTPLSFMDETTRTAETLRFCTSMGVGPATCAVTHDLEKIFYRSEARKKRAEIEVELARMQIFVESIRARIELYREWAKEMKKKCLAAAEKDSAAAEELKQFAANFDCIEQIYKENVPRMKTPETFLAHSKKLLQDLDNKKYDDEKLEEIAKKFGRVIRGMGGNQDHCVAECRYIAKTIRLQALHNYLTSSNPTLKAFYREVYRSAGCRLQHSFYHEGK